MGQASFRIRRVGGTWVVFEENSGREIGGVFATLIAALDFVDGEARRFHQATAVIDLTPRAEAPITKRAS
jgi:hypothetical protein